MTAPAIQWTGQADPAAVAGPAVPVRAGGRGGWWALLPTVVALGLGWWRLDARDLWNDELVTWHVTSLSAEQFRMLVGNIDLVHAGYYVIMSVLTTVTGDSTTALRLPSVIAIGLTAGLVTLIGRRLFDTPVGVLAGLVFALLPTVSRYAQEARSYALVTLAAVAATWLFLRAVDRPTRGRWWAYGVLLVLVGWLHFVALLVVVAHLFHLWRSVAGEEPEVAVGGVRRHRRAVHPPGADPRQPTVRADLLGGERRRRRAPLPGQPDRHDGRVGAGRGARRPRAGGGRPTPAGHGADAADLGPCCPRSPVT